MTIEEFLQRLTAAQSETERAELSLQFTLDSLPATLSDALWAAAIPHWFDAAFLAALLEIPLEEATQRYHELTALSYIEPFAEQGHNVHERTRTQLLNRLWRDEPERFRTLSQKAAAFCHQREQTSTNWLIESLYHGLLANQSGSEQRFIDQGIDWYNGFEYDKLEALLRTLEPLEGSGRLAARTEAWLLYRSATLDIRYSRNREALEKLQKSQELAVIDDQLNANCIQRLGDVHFYLAEYGDARRYYEQALPIYQHIGATVGEANCVRNLGDVHLKLAEYGDARRRYEQALPLYQENSVKLGEANCIKSLGDVHLYLTEYDEARRRYEQALPLFQQIGAKLGEANCLQSLGEVHRILAEYSNARSYEQALTAYQQNNAKLGQASYIQSLDDAYRMLDVVRRMQGEYGNNRLYAKLIMHIARNTLEMIRQAGATLAPEERDQALRTLSYALDLDEAWPLVRELLLLLAPKMVLMGHRYDWMPYLERGIENSQRHGDLNTTAEYDLELGILYRMVSEFEKAKRLVERSADNFARLNNKRGIARAFNELAMIERYLFQYEEAKQYAAQALALFDTNDVEQGMSLRLLGMISTDQQSFSEAEDYHRRSLSYFQNAHDERRIAWTLQNIAVVLRLQSRNKEAIPYFREAEQYLFKLGDLHHWAVVQMNLGSTLHDCHEYQESLLCLMKAAETFYELGDKLNLARVYTMVGINYLSSHQYQEAEQAFITSIQVFEELGTTNWALNAIDGLAMTYLQWKKYPKAKSILDRAVAKLPEISDSPNYTYLANSLNNHLQEVMLAMN